MKTSFNNGEIKILEYMRSIALEAIECHNKRASKKLTPLDCEYQKALTEIEQRIKNLTDKIKEGAA